MENKSVNHGPCRRSLALGDLLLELDHVWQRLCLTAKLLEELERWGRHGECCPNLLVAPRQGVCGGVGLARMKFNTEIISEQFAYPRVLRNGGKALIEEELEGVVIGAHDE
jgi:hypothetical protein